MLEVTLTRRATRLAGWLGAGIVPLALVVSGCGMSDPVADTATKQSATGSGQASTAELISSISARSKRSKIKLGPTTGKCRATKKTFRTVSSANSDLPDPELATSCKNGSLVVTSNSIPDYEYVATTPGSPQESQGTYKLPVKPVKVKKPNPDDVPRLGAIGVAVNGVPIYGPTEATGGDVLSLEGALSECGSHSGPVQFHMHLFGHAKGVDCLYSAKKVKSGKPVLVGWSADGYPIMSGRVCANRRCKSTKQLKSSWKLTDSAQFATDTWSAHSYVKGSGDLDECNGRVDSDGQYRYYTTKTFPYVIGCYRGEVAADAISGGGAGGP